MDYVLIVVFRLLWLFQFMLPGVVFVFVFAWIERRNEVRRIKKTDKVASADEVASAVFFTFLLTAGGAAIMVAFMSDLSDLYSYIYASVFGILAFGGFARWLMVRIIRMPASIPGTQ